MESTSDDGVKVVGVMAETDFLSSQQNTIG